MVRGKVKVELVANNKDMWATFLMTNFMEKDVW
jgi:hypothetical protein